MVSLNQESIDHAKKLSKKYLIEEESNKESMPSKEHRVTPGSISLESSLVMGKQKLPQNIKVSKKLTQIKKENENEINVRKGNPQPLEIAKQVLTTSDGQEQRLLTES